VLGSLAVLEACIVAQKASKEDSFITFRIENDVLELLFSGIIRNVVDGENGLRPSSETPSCRWKQWSELPRQARVRPKSLPDDRVARWLDGLDGLDVHFE
jgi:hypothetical protein